MTRRLAPLVALALALAGGLVAPPAAGPARADTTFATPLNNVSTVLAADHAPGSGTLTVRAGDGALFGSPSADAPVRVTVASRRTLVGGAIGGGTAKTIFLCTARSGDVLSGLTLAAGEDTATWTNADQAFQANDLVASLITAGTIADIHAAIASTAASGVTINTTQAITGAKTFTVPPVVGSLSGLLKASSGTLAPAAAGTDFLAPAGDGSALSGVVKPTNTQGGTAGAPAPTTLLTFQPQFNTSTTVAPYKTHFLPQTFTSTIETVRADGYNADGAVASEPSMTARIHPNAEESAGRYLIEWGVQYATKGGGVAILPLEVTAQRRIAGVDDTVGAVSTTIRHGFGAGDIISFANGNDTINYLSMGATILNNAPGAKFTQPLIVAPGGTTAIVNLTTSAGSWTLQNSSQTLALVDQLGNQPFIVSPAAPSQSFHINSTGAINLGIGGTTTTIPATIETYSNLVLNRIQTLDAAAKILRIRPTSGQSGDMLAIENAGGTTVGGFGPGGTLLVGGGTQVAKILSATATLDFPSTSAQSSADLTVTVTGAAVGDSVSLGLPGSPAANACFGAWVSAANTVTVRHNNYSAAGVDPASGTYRVTVHQF